MTDPHRLIQDPGRARRPSAAMATGTPTVEAPPVRRCLDRIAAPDVAPKARTTGDLSCAIPTTVPGGPVATPRAGGGLAADGGGMPVGAPLPGPPPPPGADARPAALLLPGAATRLDLQGTRR